MYAIVRAGGKQLKVARRRRRPDREALGEGLQGRDARRFPSVILVVGDGGRATGDGRAKGVSVKATVIGEIRTKKVLVFKKKRRKQYRRTKGHRQTMIQVRIECDRRVGARVHGT